MNDILAQDPITLSVILTYIFWNIAVPVAIATGIAYLMRTKAKGPKPAGKDAFQLPTAEEGRALPVVFGKRRVMSPNAISPLLEYYARGHKKGAYYYYYITLHMGVCLAADGIKQFWMAVTCLWPTPGDPTDEADDGQTVMNFNAESIWGGGKREGGAHGPIYIQYGKDDQTLHSYLSAKAGADQPAYRGFLGIIFAFAYIGTWPGLKPPSALVKRTDIHNDNSEMWYIAKANIGDDDLNAIHLLYELLFDKRIGLGKDTALLGDSFATAADTCYSEGFGLSCVWDWAPDDIESMIRQIEQIIDGRLYRDPATGKFEIGLIRADYNPEELEEFDESDFWVESMPTSSVGTVPSKVIVHWHDKVNLQSRPAVDDDIALLERQGGNPVVVELDYSAFVCDGDLANTIAARVQGVFSAMPKRLTLRALRTMSHLHETDVIKISYPSLNIALMIVRIMAIDRGSLTDGGCVIEVIEDVFGQSYTVYGSPPASGTTPAEEQLEEVYSDFEDFSEIIFTTSGTENGPY